MKTYYHLSDDDRKYNHEIVYKEIELTHQYLSRVVACSGLH